MVEPHPFQITLSIATVATASLLDLYSHRIPNWLTVSMALVGLFVGCWVNGWQGLAFGVVGLLAAFFGFLPFYLSRWMGAGDVKLLMAVGACLGWRLCILAGLATILIGAIAAFLFLLIQGGLWAYLRRYGVMVKALLLTGHFAYIPPEPGQSASVRFPYALAIALGTLAALYGPSHWSFIRIPILSGG